jgi:hypothetical protein
VSHDTHVIDGVNSDAARFRSYEEAKDYYLGLADGWTPYNPDPAVTMHDGVRVVRDDLIVGTKTRAGDLLMSRCNHDTIVYSQPRVGLAGVSILDAASRHGKRVVLFMPACREISSHQACCIERGARSIFKRVAAMRNLNLAAAEWASENDAFFVPLGLRHELATAGIVHAASTVPEPGEVYVAISTGVLSRALQIAWPRAKFTCVAVARNLKAGELGRASVISEPLPFQRDEKPENLPPFPTVGSYDGKVWKWIPKDTGRDILFWNVGAEPKLTDEGIPGRVQSSRPWKDESSSNDAVHPNLEKFGWT